MLFERQHVLRASSNETSIEAGLQELILSDMASNCIRFAVQLNNFLAAQIESQGFACWWYNISCSSTENLLPFSDERVH